MSEAEDASGKGSNLTAVEAISAKLAEVTRLAEKLDAKLCEAGARTRPVPMPTSVVSSNSSLFSNSTVLSAPPSSSNQPQSILPRSPTTATTLAGTASSTTLRPVSKTSVFTSTPSGLAASEWTSTETIIAADSVSSGPTVPSFITQQSVPMSETVLTNATTVPSIAMISPPVSSASTANAEFVSKESFATHSSFEDGAPTSSYSPVPEDPEISQEENVNKLQDAIDKSFDESAAEDSNMDGYVTATECSTTPTARSRSESFVTSPECEDLAALATVTSTLACSTCWNTEDPKIVTVSTTVPSSSVKDEASKSKEEVPKPEADGEKMIEKVVSIEKTVEEKSGKIVKEVTETTTLRVSHDTRLGVASYKVTSNTLQDHHENVDVKELKNLERMVSSDARKKANGLHSTDGEVSLLKIVDPHGDSSRKAQPQDSEFAAKLTNVCEITEEETSQLSSKGTKEMSLSLKEYTRHHEDSGIEMSPTKREDTLESEDFLERARTVSLIENGERRPDCCSCNCSNEAACFARYSTISAQPKFIGLATCALVNDNQRRLSLPNPS